MTIEGCCCLMNVMEECNERIVHEISREGISAQIRLCCWNLHLLTCGFDRYQMNFQFKKIEILLIYGRRLREKKHKAMEQSDNPTFAFLEMLVSTVEEVTGCEVRYDADSTMRVVLFYKN